jgi:hypothetical protein
VLWRCVHVHHFGGYKYAARVRKRGARATLETQENLLPRVTGSLCKRGARATLETRPEVDSEF